eukprot:8710866-Pyramimonas_sp.AAC.1
MRPPPPSTALAPCISPTQDSTSWPHKGAPPTSGTARMRPPPPSTALAPCVPPTQYSVSWPHGELHGRGPQHTPDP